MARLYASHGVDVVIDDVCVPPISLSNMRRCFQTRMFIVLLYPKASVVIDRIRAARRPFGAH